MQPEAPRPGLQRLCPTCGHVFIPDEALYCDGCGVRARSAERARAMMAEQDRALALNQPRQDLTAFLGAE